MPRPIERAPAGATHELKEVEVYEVSMVTRPAIMRDFLVVKSDKPMSVGQQLQDDGSGGLALAPTNKAFDDAAKKKLKGTLTGVSSKLTKLIASIDGASDEGSIMKSAAGIGASLSKFAPSSDAGDKDATDKSEDVAPEPAADPAPASTAPTVEAVKALAQRTEKASEPDRTEELRKRDTRDAKVDKQLATLTRAAHTLTTIVARKNASGTRPAPAAKSAGEINPQPSAPLWRSDMNSEGIPADEQFA